MYYWSMFPQPDETVNKNSREEGVSICMQLFYIQINTKKRNSLLSKKYSAFCHQIFISIFAGELSIRKVICPNIWPIGLLFVLRFLALN